MLFEKSTREGQFAGYGNILAATFVADGKEHQAFRWINPDTGKAAYYDEEGRSLKRFFLVSPLKFEPRITSHFSRRRLHPVHNTVRAHTGVDYARAARRLGASRSRPARSCPRAGPARGGNQVRIRHDGGLETYYCTCRRSRRAFAPAPASIREQVIGRVGFDRHGDRAASATFRSSRTARSSIPSPSAGASLPASRSPPALPRRRSSPSRDAMLQQIEATLLADAARQRPTRSRRSSRNPANPKLRLSLNPNRHSSPIQNGAS